MLSAAILVVVASYVPTFDPHSSVALGVFGVLLVVASVLLSFWIDGLTLRRRRKRGTSQLLNRTGPWARLVKYALGGVLVPIAAFTAATRIELPGHQTPISLAVQLRRPAPIASHATRLGNAVMRATSPAAKVQGILALEGMGSGESLDELLRVLDNDPAAVRDGAESQALSRAIAAYGALASPKLLQRFNGIKPGERRADQGGTDDLFERHFSAAFDSARNEVGADLDPTSRAAALKRLQDARGELQRTLANVQAEAPPSHGAGSLAGFVMQTFLDMHGQEDADVLAFARGTAADTSWSDAVRGQALLLVARLGSKDDMDGLFTYLDTGSPLLQMRAMQAIAELQARLAITSSKG